MEKVTHALIVEDSPDDFELYSRLLKRKNAVQITHYTTAEKAFDSLQHQEVKKKYDIVFLDYHLPRMSGIDFLKKIRQENIELDSPIIVLTGHGDEETIGHFMELHVSDYLKKECVNAQSLETSIQKARKQYELRKIEYEKQKELLLFAHTLAHDLKNPIARICSYSSLAHGSRDQKKTSEYVGHIHEEASFLVEFINKLLMYAEYGRKIEEKENISLEKVLKKSLQMVEEPLKRKKGTIEIPSHLPMIYGSEIALTQLFQNLFSNSIKYCLRRPRIFIHVVEKEYEIVVSLKDNGIGIPKKMIKDVFKPFYRGHPSIDVEGTGLGLSIVKSIADQHSAPFEIKSHLNEGTKFTIKFHR